MSEQFYTKQFPNGLTLLAQRMDQVSSVAMTLLVPAGASHDRTGAEGSAVVAVEWCMRGAGERDTRALNDALDSLGCQHHESARSDHIGFSAAVLGRNLREVLPIHADVLLRPRLEEATFEPCRDLTLQDLVSLEDEPARKCNLLLRERFFPAPLGRCIYGTPESLRGMSAETVRAHVEENFASDGAILAVAGNVEWSDLCDLVEECFGEWSRPPAEPVEPQPAVKGFTHIHKDSAQVHLALAHRSVPIAHERYYAARVAEAILSGGMSSRLFSEVREKRGLVYHVSCHYQSLKGHAGMFTYAGTRPEQAQETFDVTVGEIRRLGEGLEPHELPTARTQLKSGLVMQGESTSARSASLAGDWYHLERLRSLAEISGAIDAVTENDVLEYLQAVPAENFTILVIGPEPVDTHGLEER